jgi:hypothetical protein
MKQWNREPACRIDSAKIRTFPEITAMASQSQVAGVVRAAVRNREWRDPSLGSIHFQASLRLEAKNRNDFDRINGGLVLRAFVFALTGPRWLSPRAFWTTLHGDFRSPCQFRTAVGGEAATGAGAGFSTGVVSKKR